MQNWSGPKAAVDLSEEQQKPWQTKAEFLGDRPSFEQVNLSLS